MSRAEGYSRRVSISSLELPEMSTVDVSSLIA